jgi:predicted DsbA family dithiol-disulfide isomerase
MAVRDTTEPGIPTTVTVDVFSDVVCPWCFVGKRRLHRALAELQPAIRAVVRWRAVELHPHLPPGGLEARTFFYAKFGGWRQTERAFAGVRAVGAEEGITFNFDFTHMRRAPNTRLAHQLIKIAEESGQQDPMVEALFRGHFQDGADIGDPSDLASLLTRYRVPLDVEQVERQLADQRTLPAAESDLRAARELHITAVPTYVTSNSRAVGAATVGELQRLLKAATAVS